MTHGTANAYNKRCRCTECRIAHALRMKLTRENLATRPREEVPHGTRGGYQNWGCRCQPCTVASSDGNREASRRHQAKKRAQRQAAVEVAR